MAFIITLIYFWGGRTSEENVNTVINTLITVFSILFSIYGVSLGIISAMIDTKLFKRLLMPDSTSQYNLNKLNKAVVFSFFLNIILLIIFQLISSNVYKSEVLIYIFLMVLPSLSIFSLISLYKFFTRISNALFNFKKHEEI